MNTEVTVAVIGTGGLVLVALIGVLVELIRSRRGNAKDHDTVLHEVRAIQQEVRSVQQVQDEMKADIADVRADLKEARTELTEQGRGLARMEGRFDDHLLLERRRIR